jgi:hypothetical protein
MIPSGPVNDVQSERPKRAKSIPRVVLDSVEELLDVGDEIVGDELELRCYVDVDTLYELSQLQQFWTRLVVLEIAPPFDDSGARRPSLCLSHPLWCLPALEVLIVRNHAVPVVQFSYSNFPRLQSFKLSHPLGVPVTLFQINCPETLERLALEYLTVRDGAGLCTSQSINKRLSDVRRYATTVFFQGVI